MRRFLATALALFAALAPYPPPVEAAADLLEIFRLAEAHDPLWAAARARHDAGRERLPQGRAGLLPNIALSATRSENDQEVTSPTVQRAQRFSAESYALTITQPLYRKQNLAGYAQGQAEAERAGFELTAARQELILRVADAYFAVLAAEDALDYARAEKEAIGRLLALNKRRYAVGSGTLVDVHGAQAAYDLAVAQELASANALEVARERLRVLTGEPPPSALARLRTPLPLAPPEPNDPEYWVRGSLNNPALHAQTQALESARQELEKARAGHYPTLDLVAARFYNDEVIPFTGSRQEITNNQIALALQIPIYQGGGTSARVRELAARYEEARNQLEALKRQNAQVARAEYLAVINGLARVRALEQALASNQRALESTLLGYERGLRTSVDVVAAQRELYRTQRDLSQARYDYLLARLRLEAAAGQLDEHKLEAVNALLVKRD
jgi:outer membrane protein